jgi:hypothetical protein
MTATPTKPKRVARKPRKHDGLDEAVITSIRESLALGVPITYAATAAGVNDRTVAMWCREAETGRREHTGEPLTERDAVLRNALVVAIREGKADFVISNSQTIRSASQQDWKASAWMLSHAPETREQFSEAGRVRLEVEKRLSLAIEVLQRELPPATFERILTGISEAAVEFGA